jgi:hypothetical protein
VPAHELESQQFQCKMQTFACIVVYISHGAGLDLLALGIARTEMYTAIFDALKSIDVEYTLPPVKGGGASNPDGAPAGFGVAQRFGAQDQAQQVQLAASDQAQNARAAVAQQAILLA